MAALEVSRRSSKRKRKAEGEEFLCHQDSSALQVQSIEGKGRGVVSLVSISKGTLLFEYVGRTTDKEPGDQDDTYVFELTHNGKKQWIDATVDDGSFGRFVNDNHKSPNIRPEKLIRNNQPGIVFRTIQEIHPLDELTYDYGAGQYEWRKKKKNKTGVCKLPLQPTTCTQTLKVTEPVAQVMLSSCCDKTKKRLQKMADALNIQIVHDFSPVVTHLVMKTDPIDSRKCERTLKFFQAITNKLWVVNTQWLEKSAAEGFLLPEVDYEINADTVTDSNFDGPKKSRTSCSFLLAKYSFALSGFSGYEKIPYGDLVALITKCGGSVVDRFSSVSPQNVVLVPDCEVLSSGHNASSECTTVGLEWLFDTIATYSIQPLADYIADQKISAETEDIDSAAECDDEDYVPDVESSSDTMELVEECDDEDYVPDVDSLSNDCVHMSSDDDCLVSHSLDNTVISDSENDDHSTLYGEVLDIHTGIEIQQSKQKLKRDQKLQCCVFCEKMMTKISRHMERKHQNEKEVAQVLLLPKKSKERKQAWQALISKGNFNHNVTVLKEGKGTVIPKYRPRRGDDIKGKQDYLPCSNCFAFIIATDLWKHMKTCPVTNKISHYKGESIYNGKLLIPKTCTTSQKLYENVILKMRDDEISSCVKTENLIIEFGERCYEKLGHHLQNHQYIAQRMRELARLLIAMKDINSTIKTLAQCLEPENWASLLQGVKKVSGFNEDKGIYDIPSLALKLGHSVSKCARIIRNQGAIEQNSSKQQKAESFLNLYKDEWNDRISSTALETLHASKFNKPKLLPTVEDVHKLHKYLEKEAEALISQKDVSKYVDLAEICLVQIMLFNRKRSGEVERIQLDQYKTLENSPQVDVEIMKALSKFERALIENHKRIEIRGKKGSKVPILFTKTMARNVNCLLGLREKLGIDSQYLFAKPGSRFPIRGTDAIRKLANECGSKLPGLLKSTNLRKQLATMSQLLNLNANDQDLLAKFMGHDIQIHREYYRIPQSTLEIAKVSKVLHAINEGRIVDVKDQTFDEIQLGNEELEVEYGSSDGEDECDSGPIDKMKDADDAVNWESSSDDLEDVTIKGKGTKKKRRTGHRTVVKKNWTTAEQLAVQRSLGKYLRLKSLPGKTECLVAISKEPALKDRKWEHVKHYIRNRNISKKFQ